jgi:hypothetical protein
VVFFVYPVLANLTLFRDEMMRAKAVSALSFQSLQELSKIGELKSKEKVASEGHSNDPRTNNHMHGGNRLLSETSESIGVTKTNGSSSMTSTVDVDAFLKTLYRKTIRYKVMVIGVPFLPIIIAGIALQFSLPYLKAGCYGCYEEILIKGITFAIAGVVVTGIFIIILQLRGSPDPLHILRDFKYAYIGGIVVGVPGVIGFMIDEFINFPYENAVFSWDWLLVIGMDWYFFVTFTLPAIHAWRFRRIVQVESKSDLPALLNNLHFQKLFRDHLVSEFSVENLIFYNQVNSFKDHYGDFEDAELSRVAFQTYSLFIQQGSLMEVNISSIQRERLDRFFESTSQKGAFNVTDIPKDIFDESQNEILLLMDKDSFHRFKNSKVYQQFSSHTLVVNPTVVA